MCHVLYGVLYVRLCVWFAWMYVVMISVGCVCSVLRVVCCVVVCGVVVCLCHRVLCHRWCVYVVLCGVLCITTHNNA